MTTTIIFSLFFLDVLQFGGVRKGVGKSVLDFDGEFPKVLTLDTKRTSCVDAGKLNYIKNTIATRRISESFLYLHLVCVFFTTPGVLLWTESVWSIFSAMQWYLRQSRKLEGLSRCLDGSGMLRFGINLSRQDSRRQFGTLMSTRRGQAEKRSQLLLRHSS